MRRRLLHLLGSMLVLCACHAQTPDQTGAGTRARGPAVDPNAPIGSLRVGLYPHVPRIEQFKAAILAGWQQIEPRVLLDFVDWDGGYAQDPLAAGLDVFVFDAVFLDDFRARGWLRPLQQTEIGKLTDFVPYAIRGLLYEHAYSGIPMLGNAPMLFFRRGDDELGDATTLSQLVNAIGTCVYTSAVPPGARGLMVGLATDVENARFYLGAAQAATGEWPIPLPTSSAKLDPLAIGSLQTLLQTSSFYDSTQDPPDPYQRARWFAQGFGRAVVGPPDALSAMGSAIDGVDFNLLPLGDDPTARRVFEAHIAGINPGSRNAGWALELANVMTSSEVMIAALAASGPWPAQFSMPLRRSVLRELGKLYPAYRKLQAVVDRARPYLLNLGPHARDWLTTAPQLVRSRIRYNYACGCDQRVAPIQSQADASQKCLAVCAHHDGWTGQWSAGRGQPSACACRSCFSPR